MEVNVEPLQDNLSQTDGYNFTKFTASMSASAKVIDLKKEIHKRWELHPKQQRLTYDLLLTDNQKLLSEYGITSANPVFVELISTSIQLFVVGLGGIRVEVNENLNQKLSVKSLKTAAFGDAKCRAKEQVKLVFKGRELDWKHQLRTVQGLEDRSELHVSSLPRISLSVAIPNNIECHVPDVDLNLTVSEFKAKYFSPNAKRSGDPLIARAAIEFNKPSANLCFGVVLDLEIPLRTISDLDEATPLVLRIAVPGGHHTA